MTSVDPLDQVTLIMYTCKEQKKKSERSDPNNLHHNLNIPKAASAAPTAKHHPGKFMEALKGISAIL